MEVYEEAARKSVTFSVKKHRINEAFVVSYDEVAVSRLVTLSMES
jgi:hypothetical protein